MTKNIYAHDIHQALKNPDLEMLDDLLERYISGKSTLYSHQSFLGGAASVCDDEVKIIHIINKGIDPIRADYDNAVSAGNVSAFRVMQRCKVIEINSENSYGNTFLTLSAWGETNTTKEKVGTRLEMVNHLLSVGADPCLTNHRGKSPLHVLPSGHDDDVDVFERLVRAGTDPFARSLVGETLLMNSTRMISDPINNKERMAAPVLAAHMLEQGHQFDRGSKQMETAALAAAVSLNGHVLLKAMHGLGHDLLGLRAFDSPFNSLLHLAVAASNHPTVDFLMSIGADPKVKNGANRTAMTVHSANKDSVNIIKAHLCRAPAVDALRAIRSQRVSP